VGKTAKSVQKSALELTLDEMIGTKKTVVNPFAGMFKWLGAMRPRMKKDHAFFALLAAATEVDGFLAAEERAELLAICRRTPVFETWTVEQLEKLHDDLAPRLAKKKLIDLTEHAARSLPKNGRLSAFAHVVDLIMADRIVLPSERQFLERVQKFLAIPDDDAERMARVLKIKNAY